MIVCITGNLGFVGTETQKYFESKGAKVIGYDIMEGANDIRDIGRFESFVVDNKIDRILHLAAIARFADADKDPKLAFETNVVGTMNVAAVAKKHHIPLVYASTGSVLMPVVQEDKILTEESRAVGNSMYGCSKYIGETYVREHTPHIILRLAHLMGAEKRFHGLIGGVLSRVERGMAPVIFGGKQSNDFTYVKDVARAFYLAAVAPWDSWNSTYNIGTGEEMTADEATKVVCDVFGYDGKVEHHEMRTVDPMRFWFDVSKAEKFLKFKAQYKFKDALLDMASEMGYTVRDGKAEPKKQQGPISEGVQAGPRP